MSLIAYYCCSSAVTKVIVQCSSVGANVIRGVAGAGVLAGFDKFKQLYVYLRYSNKS